MNPAVTVQQLEKRTKHVMTIKQHTMFPIRVGVSLYFLMKTYVKIKIDYDYL